MQWYDSNYTPLTGNTVERRSGIRRFLAMGCMMPVFGLTLMAGLCALTAMIFMPTATLISLQPDATRTPLPALTPTSLPTLTPTAGPVEVASSALSSQFSPSATQPGEAGQASPVGNSPDGATVSTGNAPVQNNVPVGVNPGTQFSAPAVSNSPAKVNVNAPVNTAVPPTPPPAVGQPGNEVVVILPPTVTPMATATPRPTFTPTPAVATPTPAFNDAMPDNGSEQDGDYEGDYSDTDEVDETWSFTGVRADTSQFRNGMLVYGNLVNHSATPQDIELVSAIFYDAQGNIIGQDRNIQAYWPGYTVPPGDASMPFQLLVNGLSGAADFDLNLVASSSSNAPREDFDFSDVKQMNQNSGYCLDGRLRNPGSQLQEYLIITAILYDKRGNVINFQDEQVHNPASIVANQTYHFKICVAPPYSNVDHYDLKAWGY